MESVTATIDTQAMMVKLSWLACDTSMISGYYIFRNDFDVEEPFAIPGPVLTYFNPYFSGILRLSAVM